MAIMIGSISLALLMGEMQGIYCLFSITFYLCSLIAITNGQGAAAKLYDTIDRLPEIDSASPAGLRPDGVHGEIALEDVRFAYPSPNRPSCQRLEYHFPGWKDCCFGWRLWIWKIDHCLSRRALLRSHFRCCEIRR